MDEKEAANTLFNPGLEGKKEGSVCESRNFLLDSDSADLIYRRNPDSHVTRPPHPGDTAFPIFRRFRAAISKAAKAAHRFGERDNAVAHLTSNQENPNSRSLIHHDNNSKRTHEALSASPNSADHRLRAGNVCPRRLCYFSAGRGRRCVCPQERQFARSQSRSRCVESCHGQDESAWLQ